MKLPNGNVSEILKDALLPFLANKHGLYLTINVIRSPLQYIKDGFCNIIYIAACVLLL